MSSSSITAMSSSIGGLSHLMEAATALSKLGETPVAISPSASASIQQEAERSLISDDDEATSSSSSSSAGKNSKKAIFPQRLMSILSDDTLSDVVSWLPHGRSFVILRPDVFSEQVLPKYMPSDSSRGSSTKYPSFTRKLNRWGFRQATRGPDTGAFHHPLFRQGQPELCLDMVCQKSRKNKAPKIKKQPSSPKQLPLKKRRMEHAAEVSDSAGNSSDDSSMATQQQSAGTSTPTKPTDAVSIGSADSRSESPMTPNALLVSQLQQVATTASSALQLSSLLGATFGAVTPLVPLLPTDPALIQAALKEQQEMERMRVAKMMLLDAFLKASTHQQQR